MNVAIAGMVGIPDPEPGAFRQLTNFSECRRQSLTRHGRVQYQNVWAVHGHRWEGRFTGLPQMQSMRFVAGYFKGHGFAAQDIGRGLNRFFDFAVGAVHL